MFSNTKKKGRVFQKSWKKPNSLGFCMIKQKNMYFVQFVRSAQKRKCCHIAKKKKVSYLLDTETGNMY